jgi:hypothetical protein
MVLDFRTDDTLVTPFDTLEWFATEDRLIIMQESPQGALTVVFDYYFEADTLDMSGDALGTAVRWRLLEEDGMPAP